MDFLEQILNSSGTLQSWQSNKIGGDIPTTVQPYTSSESLFVYLHKINFGIPIEWNNKEQFKDEIVLHVLILIWNDLEDKLRARSI